MRHFGCSWKYHAGYCRKRLWWKPLLLMDQKRNQRSYLIQMRIVGDGGSPSRSYRFRHRGKETSWLCEKNMGDIVSVVPPVCVSKWDLWRLTKSRCEDEEFHFRVWIINLSHILIHTTISRYDCFGWSRGLDVKSIWDWGQRSISWLFNDWVAPHYRQWVKDAKIRWITVHSRKVL